MYRYAVATTARFLRDFSLVSHLSLRYASSWAELGSHLDSTADYETRSRGRSGGAVASDSSKAGQRRCS